MLRNNQIALIYDDFDGTESLRFQVLISKILIRLTIALNQFNEKSTFNDVEAYLKEFGELMNDETTGFEAFGISIEKTDNLFTILRYFRDDLKQGNWDNFFMFVEKQESEQIHQSHVTSSASDKFSKVDERFIHLSDGRCAKHPAESTDEELGQKKSNMKQTGTPRKNLTVRFAENLPRSESALFKQKMKRKQEKSPTSPHPSRRNSLT